MISTDRRYSEQEVAQLREQGYEFKDFTLLEDSCPMYVVSGYTPLRTFGCEHREDTRCMLCRGLNNERDAYFKDVIK